MKHSLRRFRPAAEGLEGRQLLSAGFERSEFLASRPAGEARLALHGYVDSLPGSIETYEITTEDGTARAGVDYTPIREVVTFGPGETTKVITVPLLAGSQSPEEEDFSLVVRRVGAQEHPTDSSSEVRAKVSIVDRLDITAPAIESARLVPDRKGRPSVLELTFTEPMDTSRAGDPSNYALSKNKQLPGGASTSVDLEVRSVVYDPTKNVATLTVPGPLKANIEYYISAWRALSDQAGNEFQDSRADIPTSANLAGGFGFQFGRKFTYPNPDQDMFGYSTEGTATLRIQGPGNLLAILNGDRETSLIPPEMWLVVEGAVEGKTTVSGGIEGTRNEFGHNPLRIISRVPIRVKLGSKFKVDQVVTG